MILYRLIDVFFVTFHTLLVLFNLFGWIWRRLRKWNLLTLAITGSSWLFLGMLVRSPGYCPLTDWHFRVLEKLGATDLPNSYIKYLADRLTGLDLDASMIDSITLWGLVAALCISAVLNLRDLVRSRRRRDPGQSGLQGL